jgi:hypothetical protein
LTNRENQVLCLFSLFITRPQARASVGHLPTIFSMEHALANCKSGRGLLALTLAACFANASVAVVHTATGNATTSVTSKAVTLSGVSAGNMIVVIWGSDTAANFVSCSDPTNGTYSRVGPTSWRQGTNVRAGIVYKANVAAGSPTITCTFSAGSRIAMAVAELSGIDPTNPVDLGSVSNTGGASTAISCGTTTTSNSSDEYSVAAAVNGSAATFSNPASGYTMQATASATNGQVTLKEAFSNFSPLGQEPDAGSATVDLSSTTTNRLTDIIGYFPYGPVCPNSDEHWIFDQTWTATTINGVTVSYPLQTTIHITAGNFSGTPNITSTITIQ